MNLNQYGGACRCLLRLLENEGNPPLPDEVFLNRYLAHFPDWQQRPGQTDEPAILELARDMKLATDIVITRDYDRIVQEHRAGRAVLVRTERAPAQESGMANSRPHTLLLTAMDEAGFVMWCPFENGSSEELPRAARIWWERWLAAGLVLDKNGPS